MSSNPKSMIGEVSREVPGPCFVVVLLLSELGAIAVPTVAEAGIGIEKFVGDQLQVRVEKCGEKEVGKDFLGKRSL